MYFLTGAATQEKTALMYGESVPSQNGTIPQV
jgi:hypothetical protein